MPTDPCEVQCVHDAPLHVEECHGNGSDEELSEDKWIWVLDPMTRKLRVPLHHIVPTQATSTSGTVPSLCIAFLEGRCRHPWCRQAHVQPSAIPQLRYEALNAPTCCHLHNDPHNISMLTKRFRFIRITNNAPNGNSELIPADRVASTVGLLRYLVHHVPKKKTSHDTAVRGDKAGLTDDSEEAQQTLELPAKFICRLHLAHRCRYLEDCNNIHICREYELRLQQPPHMLNALASITISTRTVTISDTCYAITPLAVGEVSDEDFEAIRETQRASANYSSTCWQSVVPAYDSAVASNDGNSPMVHSSGTGRASSTASGTGANAGMFPAVPENFCTTPGSSVPSHSPFLGSAPTKAMSNRTLRIYDVRAKAPGSCLQSSRRAQRPSGPSAATTPMSDDATAVMCPMPLKDGSVVSALKCPREATITCSTDAGVSHSTSGATTPMGEGASSLA